MSLRVRKCRLRRPRLYRWFVFYCAFIIGKDGEIGGKIHRVYEKRSSIPYKTDGMVTMSDENLFFHDLRAYLSFGNVDFGYNEE